MMERRKRKSKFHNQGGGFAFTSVIALIPLFLLSSCMDPTDVDNSWRCDPRMLQPGESRVRRIPCSDELIDGGEGQKEIGY